MYFRYEFAPKEGRRDRHIGILTGVDIFEEELRKRNSCIIFLTFPFEEFLKRPDIDDMSSTISYFTQKGNRKLHKAITRLCKAIEATGIAHVRCITLNDLDEERILYRDEYQVVLLREEGDEVL